MTVSCALFTLVTSWLCPLTLNFKSVGSAKLALAKTGALKIPDDGVKTAATDTEQIAAMIAANANCRPVTEAAILFAARSPGENAAERPRTFERLSGFKLFMVLLLIVY